LIRQLIRLDREPVDRCCCGAILRGLLDKFQHHWISGTNSPSPPRERDREELIRGDISVELTALYKENQKRQVIVDPGHKV
jgi:hypothetical protein